MWDICAKQCVRGTKCCDSAESSDRLASLLHLAEDTAVVKAQNESAHDHQTDRGRFSVPCHTSLTVGRLPIWGVSLFSPVESAVSTINSIDISGVAIMTTKTQMLTLPC